MEGREMPSSNEVLWDESLQYKNLVPETCGQWGGLGVKGCCNS